MTSGVRMKIVVGGLVLLLVAGFLFWNSQRSEMVVLGQLQRTGTLPDLMQPAPEPDENAPLVLNEAGEMVPARTPQLTGVTFDTTYTCPGGEQFQTAYDLGANAIILTLPDGEEFILPQAVSTAGARYAAWDGSVEFYEEAGEASVIRDEEEVLAGCVGRVS